MAMDLGNLTAGVEIDARNAEATLDRLQIGFKGLEEAQRKVSKSGVDVTPKGQRQLDAAKGSADKLSAALGTAGASAKGITVDRAVATALEGSATSARGLTLALQGAGAAASTIKLNTSTAPSLDKAQSSAGRLAESLNRAGQEATSLGRAGGGLGAFEGGLGRLTKGAQNLIPVLTAATGAGAIFSKGWDRLTSIDNAQFKLQGLGHTAESVGSIMDSAMQSVSGTSYGFGDAASLAAGTVAATGAQGERLTQILTTVSDVSAISGRSLSDIGLIFNQVASSGVIMGDDLNQLLDSGIPIITYLAEELGVAGGEVKKLASEGKISFEVMEAALRNNLGGAAQEMGGSVTGSLSNVGAAFGRLGAEILSGPFAALPEVIGGATGAVDAMTGGVKSLYGVWSELPGPIQTLVTALAGAKAVSMVLNTEMGGKLVDSLSNVRTKAVEMASGVGGAFGDIKTRYVEAAAPLKAAAQGHRDMAAAAKLSALANKSAFGAMDDMARQFGHTFAATGVSMAGTAKGTMGAAFGTMKAGAAGVVDMLGGPWAIALAAGAWGVTEFVGAVKRADEAEKALAGQSSAVAKAQDNLISAVTESNGVLGEKGLAAAAELARAELISLTAVGKQMDGFISDTGISAWNYEGTGTELIKERENIRDTGEAYKQLEETAAQFGLSIDDVYGVVAEGGPVYDQLINSLRGAGDSGLLAAENLGAAREEIEKAERIGERTGDSYNLISEGLGKLADESAGASEQINGLHDALEAAGLIKSTASEAAFELANGLRSIKEAAGEGIDTEATLGWGLIGEDGLLEEGQANASLLNSQMQNLRSEFEQATQSGMSATEVWEEMQEPMQALADAFGLPIEKIQELSNAYGVLPKEYDLYMSLQGGGEVAEQLGSIHMDLLDAEQGTTIPVGLLDEGVQDILTDMGYELNQLKDGDWEVVVNGDTADAQSKMEELLLGLDGINTERVEASVALDTSLLENSSDYATDLLNELDIAEPTPEAQLVIDKLQEGKDISMRELGILASETSTPAADLDPALFNEKLALSNQQLDQLHVKPTRPTVDANTEPARGKLQGILNMLARITAPAIVTVGNALGVGREHGGIIPKLAYGGPAGGYRLPTAGPGTGTTDGILGRDYATGEATAWVNRGEYVVNGNSTRRYLRTLEALNDGDPKGALRALSIELPKLESGGEVSQRIKSSLASMDGTPYVFGGWGPGGVDCTGATSLAANLAMDLPMWESRHATMNMGAWLSAKGALPGKGDGDDMVFAFYNGGPWGGHAAMQLPDGTYIESGGNTGSGLTIGGKAGPLEGRGFTDWYYLPYSMNGEEGDAGDAESELTGDGGTTVGGLGTVKALKRTGGGGTPRAAAPGGGAYNVPGLASNTPGGTTIGQSIGGQASAAVTSAFGGQASGALNAANPFVGNRTWADNLGPQITQQMTGLAAQHGFGAEVTAALESFTPNWDVWLRVNEETIDAFNNLQEARDNRKDTAEDITQAEEELEETRKQLAQLTTESGELSVQNARKMEDAEESLRKAREGGKADTIANAEKKLARVKEDIAKDAAEGDEKRAKQLATLTENLEVAELNLADAHAAAEKAAAEAAAAQQAYNLALQMAPVYAITNLFKAASDNLEKLAESFERMNGVMERTRELTVAQENAEISAVQAKIDLFNNTEEVAEAERTRTQQAHERYLAEQQAEWDLAMAKHDANQVIGASEVDLAELRKQGIYDVMQVSDEGNRNAYVAASNVAVAEAVLANTRAQNSAGQLENDLALTAAQARLEYSQIMAEAQADRLRVATEELAASQGNAADKGMSAIAKETEGKAKRTGGLVDMLVGGLKVAGAVGLTLATGGAALPAALALGASGVADFGGGFSKNQSGKAQEQAYAEEARKEYDALSAEDRKKVDLARAGVPLAAIGGAVVGVAGGSSDDVDNIIAGISDLTKAPLDAEITGRESALDAAGIRRDKQIADIEARERQAELDYKNFQLNQLETNKDQRDYLAELVALTGRQLGEHQQENQQLSELNGTLSGKNQSVLMSIGGSQWGGGSATGTIGLEPVTGFGGLSKNNADSWSTLNVEAGWGNTDRTREVVPWTYGEQEFLESLRNPYIGGLPDTVVPGATEAAKVPTLSEVQAAAIANYELLLARNQAAAQTMQVGTQFTGPVTIQGQDANDTIDELQRQLARG